MIIDGENQVSGISLNHFQMALEVGACEPKGAQQKSVNSPPIIDDIITQAYITYNEIGITKQQMHVIKAKYHYAL